MYAQRIRARVILLINQYEIPVKVAGTVVTYAGIEPATFRFADERSFQLSEYVTHVTRRRSASRVHTAFRQRRHLGQSFYGWLVASRNYSARFNGLFSGGLSRNRLQTKAKAEKEGR